jgi:hypothetical protein
MKDILRIASKLDESGQFKLSDKLMKIAQDNGKLWGIFPTAPILAPPQPSSGGKSTAVLAPPTTRSPVAPLNPPTTTPINSALCASVTGVYSQDILFIKNIIKEELSKNIEPLKLDTKSNQFITCVLRNRKYLDNRQMALAFYAQSQRIMYELSDSSKGKFYQIFYPLLKRYKLTENDLSLYKNESELQIQYSKFLDELSKKLNVNVLTDEEFSKSNENKFVWDTWGILRSRFENLS